MVPAPAGGIRGGSFPPGIESGRTSLRQSPVRVLQDHPGSTAGEAPLPLPSHVGVGRGEARARARVAEDSLCEIERFRLLDRGNLGRDLLDSCAPPPSIFAGAQRRREEWHILKINGAELEYQEGYLNCFRFWMKSNKKDMRELLKELNQ